MATQSYRERMKAQRAEARAKREAEKAEWHRRAELRYEIRKLAMDAVKAGIRAVYPGCFSDLSEAFARERELLN